MAKIKEVVKFQDFLGELKGLSLEDLIECYLEAKTGKINATDDLPVNTLEMISEVDESIQEYLETI